MTVGTTRAGLPGTLLAAVTAAATTRGARTGLGALAPGGERLWTRTNHRGEDVSLMAGPALAVGLGAGLALAAGTPARVRAAAMIAVAGGAGFGIEDDLREDTSERVKGLRGHLGALRRGRVTTGALKIAGIGASAVAAAAVLRPPRNARAAAGVLADGALIAGTANLLNLLDLRPGRALKVGAAGGLLTLGSAPGVAGAVLGACGATLGPDLAERDMLGDGGANALGATLGVGAACAPRPVRLALLAAVLGLTAASERVSFSAVIDSRPALRAVDRWGRRP
ncbi:MAG: hypothetical protein ACTMIR_12805 [Cellulomonadaceae bacterium]